jgi:type III secretion protein N (ATPase)
MNLAASWEAILSQTSALRRVGRVAEAHGTVLRVTGLQASIGEQCLVTDPRSGASLAAEVVGLSRQQLLLTPLGSIAGLSSEAEVIATGTQAEVPAGDALLGRVIDALGAPIDDKGALLATATTPLFPTAPAPLSRRRIERALETGVRAIDGLLTVGEGQRLGVFAVAGGGKSTLLGMLARGVRADVSVIVLVGERGREVREFIEDNVGSEALGHSVVVVATSDRPPLERARAAYLGTAVAEYFRGRGKRVVLLVDSVTRLARALRDVGLAVGEPPVRRGFPPSVFTALPLLFERAGNDAHGTMTAFYTVLMEDEDGDDPIAEEVRSILDGHIVLTRRLATSGHYPAIDVLTSASRLFTKVATPSQQRASTRLRQLLAKYSEIELLVQIGEYKSGSDPEADAALQRMDAIRGFLRQGVNDFTPLPQCLTRMEAIAR